MFKGNKLEERLRSLEQIIRQKNMPTEEKEELLKELAEIKKIFNKK